MKIDRLYAIMVHLLNHGRTSAGELAKKFEVSVRTIQRDIDSLCLAGIPITALPGAAGGYELSEGFQMDRHIATADDYSYIVTALQGLLSATNDRKAETTLEKIAAMSKSDDVGMILDFSVLREGDETLLQTLQSAVLSKRVVRFSYTNNNCETRTHSVEPIAVIYRWYGWYLLAYSTEKQDYRTYKLVRMSELEITDFPFTKQHEPANVILKNADKTDSRNYISVTVKCKKEAKARVVEYLNGRVIEEYENGDVRMELTVVENEQFWFGTLLSLGDAVEVLAPEEIRSRLVDAAEKIVSLYHKPSKLDGDKR